MWKMEFDPERKRWYMSINLEIDDEFIAQYVLNRHEAADDPNDTISVTIMRIINDAIYEEGVRANRNKKARS